MKINNVALLLLLLSSKQVHAQRYYGLANSNYAGINGLYINPANIADNRMLNDIHFFSGNIATNQNYGFIKNFSSFTDAAFNGKDIVFTKSGRIDNVGFFALGEARGPSFMFQVGKKHAVGVLTRARLLGSGSGFNTDYFTFINDGIRGVKLGNGTTFRSGNINTSVHAFTEIGITYGRELINKGKNYLKAGIILKRYNGVGFYSARAENFTVKLIDTSISKAEFNGSIKGSKSFDNINGFDNINSNKLLFGGPGSGIGIDIGAVYEYRDDEEVSTSRAENKYKFKIGFAIQDIGAVKYRASANTENYTLNTNGPKTVSAVDTARLNFSDLTSYFKSIGATSTNDNNATTIKAPTVITIYGDYKISKRVYINALFTTGLIGKNTTGTQTPFQAVLTPRFESTFFEAGLPISYNALSQNVKIGLGLRLGLIFIGSDDLISTATGLGKFTSANVYAGFHAAIPYRKAKVAKEKEEIATPIPLPAPVKEEVKKEIIKEVQVIDTDKDGIADIDDKCPTVAGLKKFNGCPDTDLDGIQDSEDKCPTVAGSKEFNGCADTDADRIQDSEDECPNEKGTPALKGCPDTDGDGVADKNDKCIDRPGPIENAGCPIIAAAVIKKLDFAAKAIQFETGKDLIRKVSYSQLDQVVKILNEYADYQIAIDGHTDNTGKPEKNQVLSEKRANAVKNYFASKGIETNRMTVTGYGDTKPLVKNTSLINKTKNRRVELAMKLKD
jgi:outer membrane protein OmpA-like peptidoglycan-associated protein